MASPRQGDEGPRRPGSKRKPTALFDPSKFFNAKKPTTINITSEINPAPVVPGQNTYPPARPPPTYPRKKPLTLADLPGQDLADLLSRSKRPAKREISKMGNEQSRHARRKRQKLTMTRRRSASPEGFQLPEITPPSPVDPMDLFDHTVGIEEEEHLYDEEPTQERAEGPVLDDWDLARLASRTFEADADEEDNVIDDDEGAWDTTDDSDPILSGDSRDGVLTYADVASSDDEFLDDDDVPVEWPKLSAKAKGKLPARDKVKKRNRKDPYLTSDTSTWYSSDDSRGFEKRAKNGGKRKVYKRVEYTPPVEGDKEDMGRELPKSFATMSQADKILFEWWDVEKKSWAAIARKVNELTGLEETGPDMALRYEALRRYLHHKERYFVDESVLLAYQAVDERMFLRYDVKACTREFVTLRWNLVREEYWDREYISKHPHELRAHYEKLTGDIGPYPPSDEEPYDPDNDSDNDRDLAERDRWIQFGYHCGVVPDDEIVDEDIVIEEDGDEDDDDDGEDQGVDDDVEIKEEEKD